MMGHVYTVKEVRLQFCHEFMGLLTGSLDLLHILVMRYTSICMVKLMNRILGYGASENPCDFYECPLCDPKDTVWYAVSSVGSGPYFFESEEEKIIT